MVLQGVDQRRLIDADPRYLALADEILVAGPLDEVADDIVRCRAEARQRKGWIFDIYLLRRREAGAPMRSV